MTRRPDEQPGTDVGSRDASPLAPASPAGALPPAGTRLEITEGTAWVSSPAEPAHTYVSRPPLQGPLALVGPAHDLWTAWAEGADFEHGVERMRQRYDGDPRQIRADAWSLARQLIEAGMLRLRDR